jgi:hypothetical protein
MKWEEWKLVDSLLLLWFVTSRGCFHISNFDVMIV